MHPDVTLSEFQRTFHPFLVTCLSNHVDEDVRNLSMGRPEVHFPLRHPHVTHFTHFSIAK